MRLNLHKTVKYKQNFARDREENIEVFEWY